MTPWCPHELVGPHPSADLQLDPQMGEGEAGLIQKVVLWVPPPCSPLALRPTDSPNQNALGAADEAHQHQQADGHFEQQ